MVVLRQQKIIHIVFTGKALFWFFLLVGKDMDVNEHERLSNFTL
jgi:hypothetical protein